ncbi:class I SAM-dependent methyltransferase [Dethiothermospora halolimnae]|uniref:class I SAM-dependent methyltransferase n=1 Tax=Dethiothermospora halolimnae TaxID=3114390 RepID=UPI003CCBCD04
MCDYLDLINKVNIKKPPGIKTKKWSFYHKDTQKERMAAMMDFDYGDKVLEIGCCIGFLGVLICKYNEGIKNYTGIDLDKDYIKIANKLSKVNNLSKIKFMVANGCNINAIDDDNFNTIIMAEILEHLHCPMDMLLEARRVLCKNGNIIITVPSKGALPPSKEPEHVQDFSVSDMKNLISKAKLKLIKHFKVNKWEFYLTKK